MQLSIFCGADAPVVKIIALIRYLLGAKYSSLILLVATQLQNISNKTYKQQNTFAVRNTLEVYVAS